jgi:hypothetical protein
MERWLLSGIISCTVLSLAVRAPGMIVTRKIEDVEKWGGLEWRVGTTHTTNLVSVYEVNTLGAQFTQQLSGEEYDGEPW